MPWKSDLQKMNPLPEKPKGKKGKEANSAANQPSLAAFLNKGPKFDKLSKSPSPTKQKV
jgi:hypothetical protein